MEDGTVMGGWIGLFDLLPGFPGKSPCNVSELQADSDFSSSPSTCPFLLVDFWLSTVLLLGILPRFQTSLAELALAVLDKARLYRSSD